MQTRTKKITTAAMMSALAYIVLFIGKLLPTGFLSLVPGVSFLQYDPKDVIIAIAAFILGPVYGIAISVIVSFVEMITISTTGYWGFLMNVISTCCFVCPAAFIYKKMKTMKGAVIGLILGVICMTGAMTLWNYLVTPIYMSAEPSAIEQTRAYVVTLLLPGFIPFNLIKSGINMAITLMLYKPIVKALRRAGLVEPSNGNSGKKKRVGYGTWILGLFILVSCIVCVLVLKGVI